MKSQLLTSLLLVGFYLEGIEKKEPVKKQKVTRKRALARNTPPMQEPVTLTAANLKDMLAGKLTVIMVGAEWCRWCTLMTPIFKESYATTKDAASYAYLDLGKHFRDQASLLKQLKLEYRVVDIESIPSFLVFKDGAFIEAVKGSQTKEQLASLIKKHAQEPAKKVVSVAQPTTPTSVGEK